MAEIIYGLIDYGHTRQNMSNFWDKFNSRMKREYPETYKAHTLKHCHWNIAEAFIYYYEKHCKENRKRKLDPKRIFWLTISKLAFRAKTSERTASRHIAKLIEVGFIKCKTNHGTNAACRFTINSKLLAVLKTTEMVAIAPENAVNVKFLFSAGSSAIKTVWQHTASSGLPQDSKKLNMGVRSLALPENAPEQPVSSGNTTGLNTTGGLAREQEEQGTHGRPPQDAGKGAAGREKDVDNLVASAYMFAMQTLYKGRHFNDLEHAHAQSYIKIYYTQSKNLNTAHIGFLERIILKKYQMDRHPEYFMPPPSCYFNPVFEHGFVWTKDKYREIREKRMQQADYYSNIRLFVDLYRNYSKNPGIEFYRKAEVQLGKLRDGQRLLQMFYSCVTNPDDYINQIDNYKNHATTNGQKN